MKLSITSLAASAALLGLGRATEAAEPSDDGCPRIDPGPASAAQLARLPAGSPAWDPQASEAIRATLALYALAVDGREPGALGRVFAPDARANYSAPLGVLAGAEAIGAAVGAAVAAFAATHHAYGTQYVAVCSAARALSVTYYTAAHFLANATAPAVAPPDQVLYATGRYEDTWAKQADGAWRIVNRNLVYSGPLIYAGGQIS